MPIRNRIKSVDLDERARRAMIENGFEPDFDLGAIEQVKEIEARGEALPVDGVEDLVRRAVDGE